MSEKPNKTVTEGRTLPGWYFLWTRILRWSLFFFLILFFFQPFSSSITFVNLCSVALSHTGIFLFGLFHFLFAFLFLSVSFIEYGVKTYLSPLAMPLAGISLITFAPFVPTGTSSGILYFILFAFSFLVSTFECFYLRGTWKERVLFGAVAALMVIGTVISMMVGYPLALF